MYRNEEKLVGIAVRSELSADASIAMMSWLYGRRWSSYDRDATTLKYDYTSDVIFYWDRTHNFTKDELDALNLYLERYFEHDDPKPYLCDMARSSAYLYTGAHKDESRATGFRIDPETTK